MPKIIQIAYAISENYGECLYGLGGNGLMYFWGRKKVDLLRPDEDGDKYKYIHGWILMEDEINK